MNTVELERRIRDTLASQAAALQPPDVRPDDAVVIMGPASTVTNRPPRRRVLLAAAAALVVIAGTAIASRHADGTVQPSSATGSLRAATQTVSLAASSLTVEASGRRFAPPLNVNVDGDPGTFNEYTTLELTWQQNGAEMRVNIYFTSDGSDWWANEIRTYNGAADPEWIEMHGEFFRTPLGSAYHGDFDQQSLHIHGMMLQAFLRPKACDDTTTPIAVQSGEPRIDAQAGGGFGLNVTLLDATTCAPAAADGYLVELTPDDSTIVTSRASGFAIGPNMVNFQLSLLGRGTTTLHAIVTDKTSGQVVGQVDIPVHLT